MSNEKKLSKDINNFKKWYVKMLNLILDTQKQSALMEDAMARIIEQLSKEEREKLTTWVETTTKKILKSNEVLWTK